MNRMNLALWLSLASSLLACGATTGGTVSRRNASLPQAAQSQNMTIAGPVLRGNSVSLEGNAVKALTSSTLQTDLKSVSGSGMLLAAQKTSGTDSKQHFAFQVELSEAALIKVHTFSSETLQGGLDFIFGVSAQKLIVSVGGTDMSKKFADVATNGMLDIELDVNHKEANPHVLIWINTAAKTPENALVNSAADGLNLPWGTGAEWGFTLGDARLFRAVLAAPALPEE